MTRLESLVLDRKWAAGSTDPQKRTLPALSLPVRTKQGGKLSPQASSLKCTQPLGLQSLRLSIATHWGDKDLVLSVLWGRGAQQSLSPSCVGKWAPGYEVGRRLHPGQKGQPRLFLLLDLQPHKASAEVAIAVSAAGTFET